MQAIQQFFMTSPFDQQSVANALWLIIALPALGAVVNGVFGRFLGRSNVNLIGTFTVGGSFLLSLLVFWSINDINTAYTGAFSDLPYHYAVTMDHGVWFRAGQFQTHFGLTVDHLSGTMLLVITGVGTLIHLYSTEYMQHDAGYWRFFAYMNLFVAMMLTLVLGDNLLLLFIGWEGVGFCSYLLIGFWYSDPAKAWAGRKAFITNRIGDFGFLIATFLTVLMMSAFSHQATVANFGNPGAQQTFQQGLSQRGPLDFTGLEVFAKSIPLDAAHAPQGSAAVTLQSAIDNGPLAGATYGGVLTAVLLLFLLGAAGKSAQLPLYVWLPDAMAGPTPVSALIHAATMVTAGVYLFCRMSFLLVLSPTAMAFVAVVGALTALLAALIAFAQDDLKKVLAYSTVSQLGFMFMAVGVGAFWAAVLHLVTHAFFKACLFLCAGSVMHGNADETDIKKLGGVKNKMKVTYITFTIATLAITGAVPLSGFFSKDAILHAAHSTALAGHGAITTFVWIVGLIAALGTAFYMTRIWVLTFHGKRAANARIPEEKVHESGAAMTVPLMVLSALAIVAALYGVPLMRSSEGGLQPVMENFLSPVFRTSQRIFHSQGTFTVHEGSLWFSWILAFIIAWAGTLGAIWLYTRYFPQRAGQPVPSFARTAVAWARQKFYVDELYDLLIIRPVKGLASALFQIVDTLFIDTLAVRGSAWVTARSGSVLRYFQTGDTQSYSAVMALAILGGIAWVLVKVLQ